MEDFLQFIGILFVVFGVLQIILFFKIWVMTNNIKDVVVTMNKLTRNSNISIETIEAIKNNMDIMLKNSNISTRHLCKEEYLRSHNYSLESKGITYIESRSKDRTQIIFSDKVQGEIKFGTNSKTNLTQYSIFTGDNYELIYEDRGCAINALHEYITAKRILDIGLMHKIKLNS